MHPSKLPRLERTRMTWWDHSQGWRWSADLNGGQGQVGLGNLPKREPWSPPGGCLLSIPMFSYLGSYMCMVWDISDTGRLGSGHMWDLNPLGLAWHVYLFFFSNIPGTACARYIRYVWLLCRFNSCIKYGRTWYLFQNNAEEWLETIKLYSNYNSYHDLYCIHVVRKPNAMFAGAKNATQ